MAERIDWPALPDAVLMAQCATDLYRASGPGGQKRNKTDSAVRLRHGPTGVIVTAVDSRSQHQNRARALKRMRAALACSVRQSLDDPTPPSAVAVAAGERWRLSPKHADFWSIAAWVLDALLLHVGRMSDTAAAAGTTTGALAKFLAADPDLWQAANRIRAECGQKPLRQGD